MDLQVVTFGEVLGSLLATEVGPLLDATRFERRLAGSELNTAVALARLGHRVGYAGVVGDDLFGKAARTLLTAEGIDTRMLATSPDRATGLQLKERVLGRDPQYIYYRQGSAGSTLAAGADLIEYLSGAAHLHVTGIPLAISASARDCAFVAVDSARVRGQRVSFDPNLRPVLWPDRREMIDVVNAMAVRCDWVLPGLSEGEELTGSADPRAIADHYLSRGVTGVVIKLGSAGAVVSTAHGTWRCPPFHVRVVDTLGAGDGFTAGFISALLENRTPQEALVRACALGALATTSQGDCEGMPTRVALEELIAVSGTAARLTTPIAEATC
jgi:2-dehydro-3-deoxygluconokinase